MNTALAAKALRMLADALEEHPKLDIEKARETRRARTREYPPPVDTPNEIAMARARRLLKEKGYR